MYVWHTAHVKLVGLEKTPIANKSEMVKIIIVKSNIIYFVLTNIKITANIFNLAVFGCRFV